MWKLTIEDEDGKRTELPLAHDEYGVGRAESCAVRLTERNISRNHATIRKNGVGWILEDLSSYNGTYLNGARVSGETRLGNGDLIQLGDYRIELIDEAVVATAESESAARDSDVPETAAGPLRPQRLVIVVGPNPGTEFPLTGDSFTIGRAEEAAISINHASISRIHAELITIGSGRFEVVDKQSANGIRINGVELKRGILEPGDALELGDVRLRFVGKGKAFRAGADQSQEFLAVGGLAGLGSSAAANVPESGPRRNSSKFVGIGAVVGGLIAIGLLVMALRPAAPASSASQPTAAEVPVKDEGTELVAAAQALAAGGDLDGAHKKIGEIPESSALLGGPAVRAIEAKWAQAMFDKVDASADAADKRRWLQTIAASETADKDTRKRAADQLASLATETPTPPVSPTQAGSAPPEVVAAAAIDRPTNREPPAAPSTTTRPTPTTPTTPTAEKTAAAPPVEATPAAASGMSAYEKQRRSLEPKVWGGRATEEEIRLLKAICSHMGDHACRNRAQAMLKQKQQ